MADLDVSLFSAVCTPPFAELAKLGKTERYPRKCLIVREGAIGTSLFILLEGRIRIFMNGDDERRFVIGTYGPGTMFGEVALDGGPRTASVEAISDVACSVVQYADLKAHLEKNPQFAMVLLNELIARSRATSRRMKGLALSSVYQRFRALVETEATIQQGERVLGPDWPQQEIANRLGSSRDMVTRIFRELTKGGYIQSSRGTTRVLKPLPEAW